MTETEPTKDKPWKIEIHSETETNTNGLTDEQVEDVLNVLNDDYHLEYQSNWNNKMKDDYDQFPVSSCKMAKSKSS